jgi:hypothetical protein
MKKRTFRKVPQFSYSVMRSIRNHGTGTRLLHSPFQIITDFNMPYNTTMVLP